MSLSMRYHDIMRWFESFEHESAVVFFIVFQICLGSRFPPHSDVFEGHRALRNSPMPPDPCTLTVPQPLEFLQTLQYMN